MFDRNGTLIAKYWKQNLFFEPVFDVPAEPVFTSFQTDFGVSFGTFICFDSLWEESTELLEKVSCQPDCHYYISHFSHPSSSPTSPTSSSPPPGWTSGPTWWPRRSRPAGQSAIKSTFSPAEITDQQVTVRRRSAQIFSQPLSCDVL